MNFLYYGGSYWAYLLIGILFTVGGTFIYGGYRIRNEDFLKAAGYIIGAILIFCGIGVIVS